MHLLKEAAPHRHVPQPRSVRDILQLRVAFLPVGRYAQCRIDEHQPADLLVHLRRSECGDKTTLALTDEHDAVGVDVWLIAEVIDDGTQVALLIEDRHVHRV